MFRHRGRRSTPKGEHLPVMLQEVLSCLDPKPSEVVVDCTLGFAGHASELLQRIGPGGKLIGFDLDKDNLPKAKEKLTSIGFPYSLHHGNFAGLANVIAKEGVEGCDCLLADLGMSSMQVDDSNRGFSFMRDGPLDMRMDNSRGKTAEEILSTWSEEDLAKAFLEIGDEPEAEKIAHAIVTTRTQTAISRTGQLMDLVKSAAPVKVNLHPKKGDPTPRQQEIRPTARVFQTLRILVNRESANLQELLRVLPYCLKPGGRTVIISFHSGEDRLVKAAFRDGFREGMYQQISDEAIRASSEERFQNPRSRSAKLRWAIRKKDDSE
jgi:16S rRNA (cytosine1402-N4)-methyltransferase